MSEASAFTHIWRSKDTDFPCTPTGRDGLDPSGSGRIYAEVVGETGRTYVPKEQIIALADWQAEQAKAAVKTPAFETIRIKLLRAGFSPLPLIGKIPPLKEWPTHDGASELEIGTWTTRYPAATNTGILTKTAPALDIDLLDEEAAAAIEAMAKERFEEHGYTPIRFGRFPRRAILFRTDAPFAKIKVKLLAPDGSKGHGLELLADGQQIAVDGVHPTGNPYVWHDGAPGDVKREDLAYIHAEEAQTLVDDAIALLIRDFGYRLETKDRPEAKANGADAESSGWPTDFADHDAVCKLAMKLLKAGMNDAAAVNFLRAQIEALADVDPDRRERRLQEIPGEVTSARMKLDAGQPAPPSTGAKPQLEIFDVGNEDGNIPPRQWLLGTTYCRGYLSGLISAGAGGKTTVRILHLLSAASNRSLSGEFVFAPCRAMIVCLEDDMDELRRRVRAAMLHHHVEPADVKGRLILTTPRKLKIAEIKDKAGTVAAGDLYHALSTAIDKLELDIVCIDPAIKAHSLNENDNPQIDAFASILTGLATQKNVAIDLLSHERKAGSVTGGDVNRGRGASALKDASRLTKTITGMSENEAAALGVDEADRAFLVRLDNAKVNIAPPSRAATWFRLVGVNLGNGTEAYPNGDNVQVAEPWTPKPLFGGLATLGLNCVLRKLGAGMEDGRRYSLANAAKDRAAWQAVKEQFPDLTETQCRAIVAAWAKNKLFEVGEYDDPVRRERGVGILSAKLIGPTEREE